MIDLDRRFDVLVVGGGNAALCAAISATLAGKCRPQYPQRRNSCRRSRAVSGFSERHSIVREEWWRAPI
jgi:hypothetical protein